jgi:hypothetical protein
METWKNSPTNGDLNEVPGIGKATIEKLAKCEGSDESITNTYQLFGKYLMLKGPGEIDAVEHAERFWYWLKNRGIHSHRSAIVRAVSSLKRLLNTMLTFI